MSLYEQRDDGLFCPHGKKVSALSPCLDCAENPGDFEPDDTGEDADAEALAAVARLYARRDLLHADADYLRTAARELAEERDERGHRSRVGFSTVAMLLNTAIKADDTALKYERRAADIYEPIAARKHDRWLVEQNRKLQRGGAAH